MTDLIPRLIRQLVRDIAGDQNVDEKTLQSFELQALKELRTYRSTSINRYEVRRNLDDLKGKFIFDNFKEYADQFDVLCNDVLHHPAYLQHSEVDIQWSLLQLLFLLAYKPTKSLRRNQQKIFIESPEEEKENTVTQLEVLYLKSILKEDYISVQNFEESDLSDWSVSDSEPELGKQSKSTTSELTLSNENQVCPKPVHLLPLLPALESPVKQQSYLLVEDRPDIKHRLRESIHSNSCLLGAQHCAHSATTTKRMEDNFALLLSDYIRKRKAGFTRFSQPITAPENILLRELLWVFYAPQKCQYFSNISDKTRLHMNVTVLSVSAPTLAEYLEINILPYVHQMHSLRAFLRDIYDCHDRKLPRTFEYYAANLKGLVDPLLNKFVDLEERIVRQSDFEMNTLITLQSHLRSTFKKLQIIHTVHEAVVLDYQKYPAHITSSYLLTSLMHVSNIATTISESNLAISLFLASIEAFCNILDCWWNEGRLDDWQDEFLIKCDSDQNVSLRLYSKNKEKAFFIPKHVSNIICQNRFMQLMQEHSVEAGYTLNLLYEISRIGDLRNECVAVGQNLYDAFIDDVFRQIRNMRIEKDNTSEMDVPDTVVERASSNENWHENITTTDEFLLLLFNSAGSNKSYPHEDEDTCDGIQIHLNDRPIGALKMFNELEKYQQMLPIEELISNSFGRILRERITNANKFVVDLYRENLEILRHLRNVRKVLLLEASDVMQQFYSKLFKQIEAGHSWANAFVLTMQLDDIVSSKHPSMSSLFRLEINSLVRTQTQKVTEAVEALAVSYSFSNELSKIITEADMQVYNEIFRFLLKVKWGLYTLENLRFSRVRRRPAYTQLGIGDFLMRRLEQLKFWLFYGIQCIHSHLMMHVLQAMGTQLDEQLLECKNVREMEAVHKSYLETISEHCFLKDNLKRIKFGIEQLLNLVFVLRSEWRNCLIYLDHSSPLSADLTNGEDDFGSEDYAITEQIDSIELTYIRCHQYLANMLNTSVYVFERSFLSGLSAAFNTSMPC